MRFLLSDLRHYAGESGGEHGLDDVTKGIVYLDQKTQTPHCKHHGAMLKVSKDGIWRCCVTEVFRKIVGNPEHAINHGCYYNNI